MNHRARFSQGFGAVLEDRPLLRPAATPAPEENASDTPPVPAPPTPEVVAHEPPALPQLTPAAEPISAEARANFLPTAAETLATPRPTAAEAAPGPLTVEWLERCLTRDPEDLEARLDLCTTLLVAERFADAERVARGGLERDASSGRLLLRLSQALARQDRTEEALGVAIRAVRRHRSREAILHLTRLSALAHRFAPSDGARLRKALESRPRNPVFLHALGVFESLHGSSRHALALLRVALRLERTPHWRLIVSREIARLRAEEVAAGSPELLRAAG